MNLKSIGLVALSACLGFGGMSLVSAQPRFVKSIKIEATPTAMDAANAVCFLAERSRVKTSCEVDALMSRINLTIGAKPKEAADICHGMSDIISKHTQLMQGRGWVIQVFSPRKGADKPLATCGIR